MILLHSQYATSIEYTLQSITSYDPQHTPVNIERTQNLNRQAQVS